MSVDIAKYGSILFGVFVDDASNYVTVEVLNTKGEIGRRLIGHVKFVQRQTVVTSVKIWMMES